MSRAKRFPYVYAENEQIAVYQRAGSSFWQARITLTNGKQIAVSTKQTDSQKALQWAHDHKIRIEARGDDPTAKTFKQVAEAWLKSIAAAGDEDSKKAAATLASYKLIVHRYHIPFLGTHKIDQINQSVLGDYEKWRKDYWATGPGAKLTTETITRKDGKTYEREKKVGSANKAYNEDTALRQIFQFAVERDLIPASKMPKIGTKRTKAKKVVQANRYPAFTQGQVEKILAYCNDTAGKPTKAVQTDGPTLDLSTADDDRVLFNTFIALCLGTGIRPGREHVQIKWKHFRDETVNGVDHLILTVAPDTKTGAREVRVDPFAMARLTAFRAVSRFNGDDDFVIADQKTGKPVQSFKRQFNTMCRKLEMDVDAHGKKFVPYSLRHTFATLKLEQGVDIRLLANIMGNSPEVLHAHYGHDNTVNRANELATGLDYLGMEKPKPKGKRKPPE